MGMEAFGRRALLQRVALLGLAGSAAAPALATPAAKGGPPALKLECSLEVVSLDGPAGPQLRFSLTNRGTRPLLVLSWGTPLEGWFQPFLRVTRDGVELRYQGPMLKRGDPDAAEYLRLAAGQQRSEIFSLSPAFDAVLPGLYRVEPRITLHDVIDRGSAPRARDDHQPMTLNCAPLAFTLN